MAGLRVDFAVLNFNTYADYLKSFQSLKDQRYLQSENAINTLVKLGYKRTGRIYDEADFYKCKELTMSSLNPKIRGSITYGHLLVGDDPALVALAAREENNTLKKISTIIFMVMQRPNGFEISSYKDYAHSLRLYGLNVHGATNWKGVFEGTHRLRPNRMDLSFYDSYSKSITYNESDNYQTMCIGQSLVFHHKGDHKFIIPELNPMFPRAVKRTMYLSPKLGMVVLYDHVVRKPA